MSDIWQLPLFDEHSNVTADQPVAQEPSEEDAVMLAARSLAIAFGGVLIDGSDIDLAQYPLITIADDAAILPVHDTVAQPEIPMEPELELVAINQDSLTSHEKASLTVTLQDLRLWYLWARSLGKDEAYLSKIQQIANRCTTETVELSPQAAIAYQQDWTAYQEMQAGIIQDATYILDRNGTPTANGKRYAGKIYVVEKEGNRFEIRAKKRGTILRLEAGILTYSRVTYQDQERCRTFAARVQPG